MNVAVNKLSSTPDYEMALCVDEVKACKLSALLIKCEYCGFFVAGPIFVFTTFQLQP